MTDRTALTSDARRALLGLARGTLEAHFRGEPPPRLSSDRSDTFGQARGLFVTLRRGEDLRGCIGTVAARGEITRIVSEYALRAALEDPRFPPLSAEELAGLTIEISVLGAPREIAGPEDVAIGRDGLIVEAGGRRGLLLPQVATEWGFDAATFVAEVCRKAGLPPDAWRAEGTRLWAFGAEVFGEDDADRAS
ncbi:MAG TPA: AmmeMemoRadiSam system protein A [Thermoanaerobaculia bacterium]|nr:AmmeMemoRadiSam system protein A [Thermoanaerobaculia bacterium]